MEKSETSKLWDKKPRLGALEITMLTCLAIGGWSIIDYYSKKEVREKVAACLEQPNRNPEEQIRCVKAVLQETKPRLTGCAGIEE